jgi:transposase
MKSTIYPDHPAPVLGLRTVTYCTENEGTPRVHHSAPVKDWLTKHKEEIEVFYLPSYSPELNPEERLNADLKQTLRKKAPVRTKASLKAVATKQMQEITASPDRIKAYFQDPHVKYAS